MGWKMNKLVDKFGRQHDYLRISLTDKCNLRCFYCVPSGEKDLPQQADKTTSSECLLPTLKNRLLTADEVLSIAQMFVQEFGIKKIRLTGGEPLIRKDIEEIVTRLAKLPVELAITTNGVLLDKYLPLFKKIGLNSLNISLDSLSDYQFEKITKRPLFNLVKANIDKAIDQGFNVKVNTVVLQGLNEDEINDFVEWTRGVNVHIQFIEFMPFSGNNWQFNKVLTYKGIIDRIENVYPLYKLKDDRNSTSKKYRVKGFSGTFGVISTVTSPFCSGCNRIRLTADGKLKNCLFSNEEVDLLKLLREEADMTSVIKECILKKRKERGGFKNLINSLSIKEYERGRSMISIGG